MHNARTTGTPGVGVLSPRQVDAWLIWLIALVAECQDLGALLETSKYNELGYTLKMYVIPRIPSATSYRVLSSDMLAPV